MIKKRVTERVHKKKLDNLSSISPLSSDKDYTLQGSSSKEIDDSTNSFTFTWRNKVTQPIKSFNKDFSEELGIKVMFRDFDSRKSQPLVSPVSNKLKIESSPRIVPSSTAPQVIMHQGQPIFIKDNKFLSPFFFSSSVHSEKNLEKVLEQIILAHKSGVHTFAHLIDLKVDLNNIHQAIAYSGFLIKKTLEVCREANILLRLVFLAPEDWKQKYPLSGNKLKEPSFCDDQFWNDTEAVLTQYLQLLQKTEYYKHVIGIHLERGEWFMPKNFIDTSQAAEIRFKEWVRIRYDNDLPTLRAAWFDGKITFDTVVVPLNERPNEYEKFVRTSRRTRKYVDYNLFISDQMVSKIRQLAHVIKKITCGNLLVGVSYGYNLEWSHPTNGHLSLGKLLRIKDIDFIAAPTSYKSRRPSEIGAFPCPIDSFKLNGKVFLSEEDFKTPIVNASSEPDEFNPVIKSPGDLDQIHWRGAGSALAHGGGMVWMDTWGNGWLNNPKIWNKTPKILEQLQLRICHTPTDPEVIVFIDERSLACLVDQKAFELLIQNSREAILRSGTQVGFYLLSDLAHRENFPEAKLYLFLNAWDIRPEIKSAIKNKLHKDNKILFWLYTTGLFDSGREALDHVREITGLALKPQPFASISGSHLVNGKHPIAQALNNVNINNTKLVSSSYYALAEQGATVLAEYTQTGLPSLVIKESSNTEQKNERWSSIFWGEPILTPELVRTLAQMAKAHIWSHSNDLVHYNRPFLTVHCKESSSKTITLPSKLYAYQIQTNQWMLENGSQIKFEGLEGHTYTFLIGTKSEIKLLLEESQKKLSSFEISQAHHSLEEDSEIHFDVPIMQLHQWIEDSYQEITKVILTNNLDQNISSDPEPISVPKKRSRTNQKSQSNQLANPTINFTFRKPT